MTDIKETDVKILRSLGAPPGGYTTGQVARRAKAFWFAGANAQRIESAWTRLALLRLEKLGFVRKIDELKPVCWALTDAGLDKCGGSTPTPIPLPPALP